MIFNNSCILNPVSLQHNIAENQNENCCKTTTEVLNIEDLIKLIPSTQNELDCIVNEAMRQAESSIKSIIDIPRENRTFANTILAADLAKAKFQDVSYRLEFVISWLHPDAKMREEATSKLKVLNQFFQENLIYNNELFQAYKDYADGYGIKENLSETELYGMNRIINNLQKLGAHLTGEKLDELTSLKKEIDQLSTQYNQNYNKAEYQPKFSVSKEDLVGVPEDYINRFERDGENFILKANTLSSPGIVLGTCHVEETRKKIYLALTNKGMPVNDEILKQIVEKYNKLASKLGFTSFAQMDTTDTMAKNPEEIKAFIESIVLAAKPKWAKEKAIILENLPDTVTLFKDEQTGTDKIKNWDLSYIFDNLNKKLNSIDDERIKAYFPMNETIDKLFQLYEEFMGIKIRENKANGLWHEDVRTLDIYDSKDELCGHIFLDLKKRQGKQEHCCCSTVSRGYKMPDGTQQPSASVLVSSFEDQLYHSQVQQFFHEFGHGLHNMLGRNEFPTLCGMFTVSDFMEMPSQMLEEWIFQKSVMERISSHYETGEPLPSDLIESIIEARYFSHGHFTLNQMAFAQASLEFYLNDKNDDLHAKMMTARTTIRDDLHFDPSDHIECGWFHITNPLYLSKYYGYMYSNVFAQDLFNFIQENGGVFNKELGKKYVEDVLSHGGSKDPSLMLEKFLGRAPNVGAFMKNLDI